MLERIGGPAGFSAPAPGSTPGLVGPYRPIGTEPAVLTPRGACTMYWLSNNGLADDEYDFPHEVGEAIDIIPIDPFNLSTAPPPTPLGAHEPPCFIELGQVSPNTETWNGGAGSLVVESRGGSVCVGSFTQKIRYIQTFHGMKIQTRQIPWLAPNDEFMMLLVVWHVRPDSVGSLAP